MNQANQSESNDERDFESEAKASGWVPQEDWKGPATKWVDARTFVERGEQFFPFVQAKLRKSLEKIDELERKDKERDGVFQEFRQFSEASLAREKKEREKAIAELEAARKKAISDGDGEAFDQADRKLQEARREPAKPNGPDAATQGWLNDNPWYNADPVLQSVADGMASLIKREKPQLTGRAFLDEVTARTQSEMPHKFQNSRRETVTTEDHQRKSTGKKGRAFEDLPADAQAACERFVKQIPGFTREKYLSQYDWSE